MSELAVESLKGGAERYLNLCVALVRIESGQADMAAITVEDVTEQVQTRRRLEAAQAEQKQLLDEIGAANAVTGELNEQLQAANEEREAASEELQAINEELEANNEELQVMNEELETANEELSARTAELQETAKSLADERARLAGMVELAPFDMMILSGSSLIVNAANARAMGFSGGREILGRPFAEIFDQPEMADLGNVT